MASGPKMTLKAREFGREITNGNASSSSTAHNSNPLDKSVGLSVAGDVASSQVVTSTSVISSSSQAVNSSITSIAKLTTAQPRKVGEVTQHPTKVVSLYFD